MHNSQSLKLLNKINRLFENLQDSDGMMNEIEKDLLLTYIRELYASIKYQKAVVIVPKVQNEEEQIISPNVPQTDVLETESIDVPVVKSKESVPEISPDDTKIEKPDSSKNGTQTTEDDSLPIDNPILDLIQSHKELRSGYHGGSLISDLNKAFGLNDRIYYANQLFQGDQLALIEVIEKLNQ